MSKITLDVLEEMRLRNGKLFAIEAIAYCNGAKLEIWLELAAHLDPRLRVQSYEPYYMRKCSFEGLTNKGDYHASEKCYLDRSLIERVGWQLAIDFAILEDLKKRIKEKEKE